MPHACPRTPDPGLPKTPPNPALEPSCHVRKDSIPEIQDEGRESKARREGLRLPVPTPFLPSMLHDETADSSYFLLDMSPDAIDVGSGP